MRLRLQLVNPSEALQDLIALSGLGEVLLSVEPRGQAEQWEQTGSVKEKRQLDDAPG